MESCRHGHRGGGNELGSAQDPGGSRGDSPQRDGGDVPPAYTMLVFVFMCSCFCISICMFTNIQIHVLMMSVSYFYIHEH